MRETAKGEDFWILQKQEASKLEKRESEEVGRRIIGRVGLVSVQLVSIKLVWCWVGSGGRNKARSQSQCQS